MANVATVKFQKGKEACHRVKWDLLAQLQAFSAEHEAQGEDTTAELLQHAPAIMESALDYAELHCNTPQAKMDPPADLPRSLCFSPLPSLSGSDPDPRLVSAVSEAISPKAAGFKRVPSSELGAAASSAESPKARIDWSHGCLLQMGAAGMCHMMFECCNEVLAEQCAAELFVQLRWLAWLSLPHLQRHRAC